MASELGNPLGLECAAMWISQANRTSAHRRTFCGAKLLVSLFVLSVVAACHQAPVEHRFSGQTMGTSYLVHAFCAAQQPDLQAQVEALLAQINAEMSTYQPDSVLSRFNRSEIGSWQPITPAMHQVLSASLALSELSAGAFDVTVGPLVNLWGFGPDGRAAAPPSPEALTAARQRVGYQHLELRAEPPALRRLQDAYVDLSAIAKGYGVDAVFALVQAAGCDALLVEIGGDLRVGAAKPDGSPWRIGIEAPDPESRGQVHQVLAVTDLAMATSGDYRNYLLQGGRRLSHTIDPATRAPGDQGIVSINLQQTAAKGADGYATLFGVLPATEGLALAEALSVPLLMLVEDAEGLQQLASSSFQALRQSVH